MPSVELIENTKMLADSGSPENPTIEQMKAAYDGFGDLFPADSTVHVSSARLGPVPAHRLEPRTCDGARTVLYFHGGGYVIGSLRSHAMIVTRLADAARSRVWFPDYRMAPAHPFPAPVDDCVAAWRALVEADVDPARTAFAGDSAGGGLVFAVLLRAREEGLPLPACGWSISPWADMEGHGTWRAGDPLRDPALSVEELDFFARTYMGTADHRHPWAAPIHGDLAGLPPVLIQVGSLELLLDDSVNLAEAMKRGGSTVTLEVEEGAAHVWHHMVPDVPEAVASIKQGARFIVDHTS